MNDALFERLLYEDESTTLDFKREQYPFVRATDEEKSELLKDILGFANAWRRAEAYILIGVEEVRGGRSNVIGIPAANHLDDHALQQFVNNLTNRPVRFQYETFSYEGKQVGILRIHAQPRPIYIKKDYGKLKKGAVYIRRGSSTDPTKPADPDEIARMGMEQAAEPIQASLSVEFAQMDREQTLGKTIDWRAEFCEMPGPKETPDYNDRPTQVTLPGGRIFDLSALSSLSDTRANPNYYRELANYTFFHRAFKKVRLVVINKGEVPANDVRLEITVLSGQGFGFVDTSEAPPVPKRRVNVLSVSSAAMRDLKFRPALRSAGDVAIDNNEEQTKLEIECRSLQPGRKIWSDPFFLGIGKSGQIEIAGLIYAANLPQPQQFTLSINAQFDETRLTVDELLALPEPEEDE